MVFALAGGMSVTWRRPAAVTSAPFGDSPQQPHFAGRCRTLLPGRSVNSIVAPGFRPDLPRSGFGAGLASPSDDGGFDEFREFAFTCAARSATCDCSAASDSRSAATSAFCSGGTATSASRSARSSRSRAFAARSPAAVPGTAGTPGTRRTTPQPRPASK